MTTDAAEEAPNEGDKNPISILKFARFFQVYGFALGLIVAALPFGLSWTNFFGYYQSNSSFLTFLASLVAFLAVAIVFGARHRIGAIVFPNRKNLTPNDYGNRGFFGVGVPLLCSIFAVVWLLSYSLTLSGSVDDVAVNYSYAAEPGSPSLHELLERGDPQTRIGQTRRVAGQLFDDPGPGMLVVAEGRYDARGGLSREFAARLDATAYDAVLRETSPASISYSFWLTLSYVMAFACASLALIWMGLLDYLQDQLEITDASLMRNPYKKA